MYSSIDSVTEMTSGNIVHGFCMVPHGSGKGPIVGGGGGVSFENAQSVRGVEILRHRIDIRCCSC